MQYIHTMEYYWAKRDATTYKKLENILSERSQSQRTNYLGLPNVQFHLHEMSTMQMQRQNMYCYLTGSKGNENLESFTVNE
jgi:hypothetical protein